MSILIFILSIMLLVIVHEAGHYFMARFFGVAIAEFSIGFGQALWSYQHPRFKTRFKFAPILLGGYVKFYEAEPPQGSGRLYHSLGLGQKILVLLAGPLANLLFAFWVLVLLFKLTTYSLIPRIGDLEPGGMAAKAGLTRGQKIVAVNHRTVHSWDEVLDELGKTHLSSLQVASGQQIQEIKIRQPILIGKDVFQTLGFKPFVPKIPAVIGQVQAKSLAEQAGLREGDKILALNQSPIDSFLGVLAYLKTHSEQALFIRYQRHREILHTSIGAHAPGIKLGIYTFPLSHYPQWFILTQNTWPQAIVSALHYFAKMCWMQLRLWFHLPQEIQHLSSPWGISKSMTEAWSIGVKTFLQLMVWLSISLAMVNLLPIPILDGGQCLIVILEYLFPGFLNLHRQRMITIWSVFLLLGLFAVGLFNDFTYSS